MVPVGGHRAYCDRWGRLSQARPQLKGGRLFSGDLQAMRKASLICHLPLCDILYCLSLPFPTCQT